MNTTQKQDLLIFSDHSIIPHQCSSGESHDLILVTHTSATSPSWLCNALIETQLMGAPFSLKTESTILPPSPSQSFMTIGSFIHDYRYFENSLTKLKINPTQYHFVDCLTDFVVENAGKPKNKVLNGILNNFLQKLKANSTVILEEPEILLGLIDGLTSNELHQEFITPLMRNCGLLIISTSTELYYEYPTYDVHSEASSSSLDKQSIEYKRFTMSCIYKALVVLNLKQLDTGRAKDITGTLRITRGGCPNPHDQLHVVENEYLYLKKREVTKLFYR